MSRLRYRAFISYSHQDESWGRWLQKALEGYRIPRRLVGKAGEYGPIPARLTPIFRDREDLPSATDLSQTLRQELSQAESLVVICSPAAAQSHWVNEEIRQFRSLGRTDRIYALIVDGDPSATDLSGQCFPPALTNDDEGNVRDPLAADVRKWADGQLLAKLKLVAGIVGIRLDDLRRRDLQRRHRLWMASSTLALAIAVSTSILAIMAVTARNAAENRREHAENLVGYMVGDLREKLDSVGRLDILDSMGEQVTEYLDTLDPGEVTDESLNQLAKVWRQLGEVSKDQGKLAEAMEAFTNSRDVLAELYRRQPDNADRLFELGQAEFWVGYVHLDMGTLPAVEKSFSRYLEISQELMALQPDNAVWLMEMSYAMSNMGWLEEVKENPDPDRILEYIESSLDYNRQAVAADPHNADYRFALTETYAYLADAYLSKCDLENTLRNRMLNVGLAREFFQAMPGDSNLKEDLAQALHGLGNVQMRVGSNQEAFANFSESEGLLDDLSRQDSSNLDFRWQKLLRSKRIAELLFHTGRHETAGERLAAVHSEFNEILRSEESPGAKQEAEYADLLGTYSAYAYENGDPERADTLLQEGLHSLAGLAGENPDHGRISQYFQVIVFQFWRQHESEPDSSIMAMLEGQSPRPENVRSCNDANAAAHLSLVEGDPQLARQYTQYLIEKGYRESGFINFCRQYALCEP